MLPPLLRMRPLCSSASCCLLMGAGRQALQTGGQATRGRARLPPARAHNGAPEPATSSPARAEELIVWHAQAHLLHPVLAQHAQAAAARQALRRALWGVGVLSRGQAARRCARGSSRVRQRAAAATLGRGAIMVQERATARHPRRRLGSWPNAVCMRAVPHVPSPPPPSGRGVR